MARAENEPPAPKCLDTGSLVFAPTAGTRPAPELIVFELFRELGYGDSRNSRDSRAKSFSDAIHDDSLSEDEHLLLLTCLGRQKKSRTRLNEFFYAPPYLGLTRHAWLRKRTDRIVRDYFLGGPLSYSKSNLDKDLVVTALLGHHSAQTVDESAKAEILSLIALESRVDPSPDEVLRHLEDSLKPRSVPLTASNEDPIASTISDDFIEICRLEGRIARREWIFFLTAFLSIATTVWILAHLRVTIMIRDWLLSAAMGKDTPSTDDLHRAISQRYEGLLHPSSTPTREVSDHVDTYMRARVELRLLVHEIQTSHELHFRGSKGTHKLLSFDHQGADFITLSDLLNLARSSKWLSISDGEELRHWLTRKAEKYPAWRSPRTRGQGKNLVEFIPVLHRSADDDSGSGLFIRCSNATTRIVPGHRLLQLFAFLAGRSKVRSRSKKQKQGKLLLRDIEQHLYDYGIDFRSSSFGRPLLIEKLLEGGFLVGSPDAGESAEVFNTLGRMSDLS